MRKALCLAVLLPVLATAADPIVTDSTSNSTVNSKSATTTTIRTNPPSAISPSINASNSDLCAIGVSGAVQTQIIGISTGQAYRDANCERLKISKILFDMGMKVAAVSVMCQDFRVFDAMLKAGTPCPIKGKIGTEAKALWVENEDEIPIKEEITSMDRGKFLDNLWTGIAGLGVFAILLL